MVQLEQGNAKGAYLDLLQDSRVTPEMLREMLVELEKSLSPLWEEYQPMSGKNDLDHDSLNWSAEYFSRHRTLARQNFSRKRIEHLLEVREYLRAQRIKGFAPRFSPKTEVSNSQKGKTEFMVASYIPSDNLRKFVNEGELHNIRAALIMELHDNSQTSADLEAAINWTKRQVSGLFKAYTEKTFAREANADQSQWSSEYYNKQVVYLEHNFSEERFIHLIKVRDFLRQQGLEGFIALPSNSHSNVDINSKPTPSSSSQSKNSQTQHGVASSYKRTQNPVFKSALIIGGAAAALAILLITFINGQK